ncbi:MAG TPA: hypothetical protein VK175_16700 [Leadbetterella sp.]|nr:hypothetical protein [Leadbetterella sp.]
MRILAIILLLLSAYLSLKHGWDSFQPSSVQQIETMSHLGIKQTFLPFFGVISFAIGAMLFIPKTFFLANVLNVLLYAFIMALLLKAGDHGLAIVEIVFIAIPLLMIKLKYPFKKSNL